MSCEGCKNPNVAEKSVISFGKHLGNNFVPSLQLDDSGLPSFENLSIAVKCILDSMNASYTSESGLKYMQYTFEHCPLHETAQASGLMRGLFAARMGITTFIDYVVQLLEPEWLVLLPTQIDPSKPLLEISIIQN
jgi:hypothetical protein